MKTKSHTHTVTVDKKSRLTTVQLQVSRTPVVGPLHEANQAKGRAAAYLGECSLVYPTYLGVCTACSVLAKVYSLLSACTAYLGECTAYLGVCTAYLGKCSFKGVV